MNKVLLRVCITFAILFAIPQSTYSNKSITTNQSDYQVTKNLSSMPLSFTENQGQWDEQVKFRANSGGAVMWFASDGAYYQFTKTIKSDDALPTAVGQTSLRPDMIKGHSQPDSIEIMMIKANFVGANLSPQMVGVDMMEYKCNYFIGNDESKWATDVPNYKAVMYEDIYNGIDLKYYGNGTQMEYDFIVDPGADYSQIKIQYEGAESIAVNDNGELVVTTMWGEVVEQRPVIYQIENNSRISIDGKYSLQTDNSFSFKLNNYDASLPLVIDPILAYSTYLGGNGKDESFDIAVGASGAAYVSGSTSSTDFPTQNPYQGTYQGNYDGYVTKLSPTGNNLVYCTYLGGSNWDEVFGVAVDSSGSAYVTGWTGSDDFPTQSPFQGTNQGGYYYYFDAFVTKLSPTGNSLVYSTYLGGTDWDQGHGIAVDTSGAAYVTGTTWSPDFPTQNPYQGTNPWGLDDAFVTKLSPLGTTLVYSTYLGGNDGSVQGIDVAVDISGSAYVVGTAGTYSNLPTQNPYQGTRKGNNDAFVTKFNSSGDSLVYSTYLGGNDDDYGYYIAVDTFGSAYIIGSTNSTDFPTINVFQGTLGGTWDVFVTKLNPSGSSLGYSTYLGGSDNEDPGGIVVDVSGSAFVAGITWSIDFPTLNPYQGSQPGVTDVFVTKFSSSGNSLIYSTYLGGSDGEFCNGIGIDTSGSAYVTGSTMSTNFPTLNPYQGTHNGTVSKADAYVTKFSEVISGDIDGDGIADSIDNCPNISNPAQSDTDSDGIGDVCDVCAGFDDNIDTDADGVPDGCDICPGNDDSVDSDADGVPDGCDICPGNDDSVDSDSDGVPDGCDICPGNDDSVDSDSDGVPDGCDICPGNDDSVDSDSDGVPDGCDICPGNDDSVDSDSDGVPDGCDICPGNDDSVDSDSDGVPDGCDICPGNDDSVDSDSDGVPDGCDNCPLVSNPLQVDTDSNGIGDACEGCCVGIRGNVNGDAGDNIDVSDLVYLVAFSFQGGPPPPCLLEADVDGSGSIDVSDLVYLVAFSFQGGPAPAVCP